MLGVGQSSKTDSAPEPKTKQAKTSDARPSTPDVQKPTLTEKDLEFDFDHSQIRDPRATPGRVKRPRAGFQLDYEKVAKWMKPVAYNEKSMVNGMERHLERVEEETKKIYDSFFIDGKGPDGEEGSIQVMDQSKDQVSKDLGVPWHQIDPKQLKKWEDQGFAKVDADKWWHRLNQVERDRFMKMLGGASLRKDL
ncbi:hypothetical protein F25303_3550 [Fusarium sp. NRRL 25303]|nr:hypothetical protein F25303_3550 [Fusarium sp. NRRL 25303]